MSARVLVTVAVLLALAGCSTGNAATPAAPATDTAAPTLGSVGQAMPFLDQLGDPPGKGTVTINSVRRVTAATDDPYAKYGSYLILDVTITMTQGQVPADGTEFQAKGKSGRAYSTGSTPDGALTGVAQPGSPCRGDVALGVPKGDGPYKVTWTYGNVAGSTAAAEFSING